MRFYTDGKCVEYDDQRGHHLLDVGLFELGLVVDVQQDHFQLGRVSHFLPFLLIISKLAVVLI